MPKYTATVRVDAYQLYSRDFVADSKQTALDLATVDWETTKEPWDNAGVSEMDDWKLTRADIEEIPLEPLVVSSSDGVYDETPPFTIFDPETQDHLSGLIFPTRELAQTVCDFLNLQRKVA